MSKLSKAAGHSLRARLNHLSRGLTLEEDEEDEQGEEQIIWSPLKFLDDMKGVLDSRMMWRLLAKNSNMICSAFAPSELLLLPLFIFSSLKTTVPLTPFLACVAPSKLRRLSSSSSSNCFFFFGIFDDFICEIEKNPNEEEN